MTLIGLVLVILLFGIVLAVGNFLDALPGTLSIFGFVAILFAIVFFLWLIKKRALPVCRNGSCRVKDYKGLPVQANEHGAKFRCQCGDIYRLEGNKFFFISKDGCEAVHKIRKHTGGAWVDPVGIDEGQEVHQGKI